MSKTLKPIHFRFTHQEIGDALVAFLGDRLPYEYRKVGTRALINLSGDGAELTVGGEKS